MKKALVGVIMAAFVVLIMWSPAWADHIRGVRIDIAAADSITFVVTINITGFADFGVLGDTFPLGFSAGGFEGPAIDWGDGAFNEEEDIVFVDNNGPSGTARFRGTFTHTYPDASPRTLTTHTGCCVGFQDEPNNDVVVGELFEGDDPDDGINGVRNQALLQFDSQQVPEPSSLVLLATGLAALGSLWVRRLPRAISK